MSTPNPKDNAPKKPAVPPAKKPAAPPPTGKPAQPAASKPAQPAAKEPVPVAKPAIKKASGGPQNWSADGGSRKIGQILVDLGFLDENQLWDLLEEARTNSVRVGHVALSRGLITEDQLLQAVAEQHNLKVVNLEEQKP